MQWYYHLPEETAETLHNGWLLTGDLGYVDEDGFLFLPGRKKNLIITKNGENVSPEELENKLLIEELLQQLAGREQQLIKMRYFENATQSQIAAKLGTSQVQVSRMEKKILLQMRKYMSQGWQTKGVEIY